MTDYVRRFLIVFVMAVCILILFIGGTVSFAEEQTNKTEQIAQTDHLWFWPTAGHITDTYGTRSGEHYGIDIAAPAGTPTVAVDGGVVSKSYYSDTYGNVIFITHNNGYETVYAHLDKRIAAEGERVQQGERIGYVGNTGRSSGNHLHFEVHKGKWNVEKTNAIDPYLVLADDPPKNIAEIEQPNYPVMASYHEQTNHEDEKRMENKMITVQHGDTLWGLASKYNIPISEIKSQNHLSKDVIYPGQRLVIDNEGVNTYYVRQGDTLSTIAGKSEVTVRELKQKNQLDTDRIYPGDVLVLY